MLKWVGGVMTAIATAAVIGASYWLVGTVNTMQLTLERMDERSLNQASNQEQRFVEFERRISKLEAGQRIVPQLGIAP